MSTLEAIWDGLLEAFSEGLGEAISELENKNIENIPGAKDALTDRLEVLRIQFPRNDGELLKRAIDNTIQNAFFPNTSDLAEAFNNILKSRTHEQDFIINELLNGFVTSKAKAIASYNQGPIIDRIVEAFAKRSDFHIVDHQFYAMFGDPNKPRSYVKKQLQELISLFGLVSREIVVDKDLRSSEKKVYTFYTFPSDLLTILKEKYIIVEKKEEPFVESMLELLQSSKDTEATEIRIKINSRSVRFIDNGRGINKEKVDKYFSETGRSFKDSTEENIEEINDQEKEVIIFKEINPQIANFGKVVWKTQNWIRYIDKKRKLDLFKESKRHVKGTEITIILNDEIENKIKNYYENRFKEAIQYPPEMEIYINDKYYEKEEKEIKLDISIDKKVSDKNLVYARVSEAFDRNVFISLFLANLAINRRDLDPYTINGISAIFALILLLSFMPKLTVRVNHPILKDPSFNNDNMSIIPKSWMMRQILESLFEPLIKIVAFRLGGGLWLNNIIDTEINKKIHNQIRFLLKDVNKWILGNLCRVEIPIFVEIANIFAEVTVSLDRDEDT